MSPFPRKRSHVPRRKMKRVRRGASVTVYLEFELLTDIRAVADHEGINFNDAVRELLFIAADAFKKSGR
jgi:predicted DNA binding CopG/RHH family protein